MQCNMNFGTEARLDGSQHIAVETQQVMAVHLHIYYFISAFRIPTSHKPVLSPTHTYTYAKIDSSEFEKKASKSSVLKKIKCLVYFMEF